MLHQSQPISPCSGCLRCSDGCRRRCRGRSSEHAIDVWHLRTGHNYALLSNPGTHHNPLSAGIAWERPCAVVMARSHMPDVDLSKWHHFSTIYNAYVRMTRATRLLQYSCRYRTEYRLPYAAYGLLRFACAFTCMLKSEVQPYVVTSINSNTLHLASLQYYCCAL